MLPSQFSPLGKLISSRLKRHGLLSLFAFMLSLSVVLGTVTPIQSQTTSPPPNNCAVPQALCADIKQLAQDDVADDIPRRTSHAIELFKEKHPDWKTDPSRAKLEISRTYDHEYSQQEKVKKQDLNAVWDKLTENGLLVPFIGAIALAIVAWFRGAIEKGWMALVKAIDNWVYGRFAGTPLFESLALQRYRKALVENYQHLKIPFRVNQKPLEMSEIYVPLKVAGLSDSDQVDAYRAIAQHRRLVITGIPGSGKTMLLRHVAFSYGKGRLTGLENRPVPVLVELHRLSDPDLTEEKLISAIVDAFKRNRFPNAERFIRHSLEHGKLMLLLDGLDEVNSGVRSALVQRISDLLKSVDEHQRCRLIVTCRTAVYDNEFAHETDQTLEVVEFTDQQMRRFLSAWQQEIPRGKSIDQLMQTLRDRPRIMALARNPLLLTIIVHLYTEPTFELPRSRTEFYQVSTRILLEQWQDQLNHYRGGDKRRLLQYLALHQQQASTQQQQDRRSIDYPVVLEKIRQLLPSLNLDPDHDTVPILDELVERSGLFLKIDGGDRYQFAHLTLQEYFAAEALADKKDELSQFFQQDPTTWREVVKLWCGISGDSTTLITDVYQQDVVLGFECLADAQEVDQHAAESIIAHCKGLLGSTGEQDEITKAFGAVAASNRPRGKAIFQFLVETLETSREVSDKTFAANALSLTNSPEAAEILTKLYLTFLSQGRHLLEQSEVRQPLIRMGDLAVPGLQKHSLTGSVPALDDLQTIGTPDAAEAIVSSIWFDKSEEQQFSGRAAIHLATLLPRPDIEDRLRDYPLSAEQRNLARLDWVWQPFNEPPDSALPVIAGRISYLLSRIIFSAIPQPLPSLDPRLVIPVCGIQIFDQAPFPSRWSVKQVNELLIWHNPTLQIDEQCLEALDEALGQGRNSSSVWRILFSGLPPRMQLELLQNTVKSLQKPNPNNWINIFQSVQYEFKTSRHYRSILLITALLSLLAGFGIWYTALRQPIGTVAGVLGFTVVIICVFWLALAKGIEEPWEPSLFVRLGPLGLQTYTSELTQLFQNRLAWAGIEVLFKLFRPDFAVFGAVAAAGAAAAAAAVFVTGDFAATVNATVAVVGAGVSVGAFVGASVGAVTVTGAVVGAGVGAVTVTGAVVGAGVGAVTVTVTVTGAGAGAVTGAFGVVGAAYFIGFLAGLGVGSWYHFKAQPEKQWHKFFSVLALPWFCTAPIVLGFAGVGLASLFTPLAFLPVSPWQSAGLLELFFVGVSSWLWWWGQKREAMARNPLQGGLIEATLRAKYGRHRKQ
jgi:MoxR-like ATPase